jgi:nucleoside-diphosphate-sugar epimerase
LKRKPGVLLTGANGYLGRATAEALKGAFGLIRGVGRGAHSGAALDDYVRCDLISGEVPSSAFADIDVVIHAAGVVPSPSTGTREAGDANPIMTITLLDAMRRQGVTRLVFVGSASVYGPSPAPLGEGAQLRPVSAYGAGKLACEQAIADAARRDGLSALVLRKGSIYGGSMPPHNNVARMIGAIANHRFFVPGDGRNRKSFLHVDDAARAIAASTSLACDLAAGETLTMNVAAPSVSVSQVARAIAQGLRMRPPPHVPMAALWLPIAIARAFPRLDLAASVQKLAGNDELDLSAIAKVLPHLAFRDSIRGITDCAEAHRR